MPSDKSVSNSRVWHSKPSLWFFVVLALGLPLAYPELGVLGSFAIAIVVAVIARKHGSFRDMGFRRPESWSKLIGTTLLYGFAIQVAFTVVIEPGLSRLTGDPVDISVFDDARGDFVAYLILLVIGWVVGGFLEEFTFRGFIVGRVRWLLGSGAAATWVGVLAAAVPFGIAHLYQGVDRHDCDGNDRLCTGCGVRLSPVQFVVSDIYARIHQYSWHNCVVPGYRSRHESLVILATLRDAGIS